MLKITTYSKIWQWYRHPRYQYSLRKYSVYDIIYA